MAGVADSVGVAGAKVAAYFITLVIAAAIVVRHVAQSRAKVPLAARLLYGLLALAAMYFTWKNIIGFMVDDFSQYENVDDWLKESEFFSKAYMMVSDSAAGWWWSSQLLMWVLPFVVFVCAEASKDSKSTYTSGELSVWVTAAVMWVGFGGAISVAYPLFLCLVDHRARPASKARDAPLESEGAGRHLGNAGVYVVVVLGALSITALPYFTGDRFDRNLIFLHVVLFLPALMRVPRASYVDAALSVAAIAALSHHALQSAIVLRGVNSFSEGVALLAEAGFANKCQAGISLDIVFATLETVVFVYFDTRTRRKSVASVVLLLSPFTSLSFMFSMYLLARYRR